MGGPVSEQLHRNHPHKRLLCTHTPLVFTRAVCLPCLYNVMISAACPEALMRLSAMVFYHMRSRDYPTCAWGQVAPS